MVQHIIKKLKLKKKINLIIGFVFLVFAVGGSWFGDCVKKNSDLKKCQVLIEKKKIEYCRLEI